MCAIISSDGMVRGACLCLLLLCISPYLVTLAPILEDDSWNVDWPFELDELDDESRKLKTSNPLLILCPEGELQTRRTPNGGSDNYIIVKPGSSPDHTKEPCLVTRHPPTLRSSTHRSNNVAIWPAIIVGTRTPPANIDTNVLNNVANQLLLTPNDDSKETTAIDDNRVSAVGEILHGNFIDTTPNPVTEVEVECGCDADVPVHAHTYVPSDNEVHNTPKPVTSNSVQFFTRTPLTEKSKPNDAATESPILTRITKPTAIQTITILNFTKQNTDWPITRAPEESLLGSVTKANTPPRIHFITDVVTSTSEIERPLPTRKRVQSTTTATRSKTTTTSNIHAFLQEVDDDPQPLPSASTTGNMSSWGSSRIKWWLHFISKHALFILLGLIIFGVTNNLSQNPNTLIPSFPQVINPPLADYQDMFKIYDSVLTSVKEINNNYNNNLYPLPTNYANSQASDVYDVGSNDQQFQLDYILNAINNYKNYQSGEMKPSSGYG